MEPLKLAVFNLLRFLLVRLTGRGYDRSVGLNNLHHKLAYRLHKLLPLFGIRGVRRIMLSGIGEKFMYVRAEDGGVAHQLIMYRAYEPFESSVVMGELKPGMTVYNIGANLGYYALVASACVGETGKVYAFEPAPENLELLGRTIRENGAGTVRIFNAAIAAADGTARLALSTTNSGDHQLRQDGERASVAVEVRSVDSLLAEDIPAPDAIIMDVQGSELDVVLGMPKLLATSNPTIVFTEFWPRGLDARHPDGARKFLDLLTNAGFGIHVIDEKRKQVIPMATEDLLASTKGNEERNLMCRR